MEINVIWFVFLSPYIFRDQKGNASEEWTPDTGTRYLVGGGIHQCMHLEIITVFIIIPWVPTLEILASTGSVDGSWEL